MSVPSYKDRLLEIHGINMWNTFHVDRAIRFAKSCNLTGIIFHCNELIDKVVFPDKYFDKDELLSFNPVRNSVTKNYRYYLRSVLDKCRENGLEFYGEVKEIYFHNDLITKYPQLRGENGALCATDPFWWEFLEEKYREFFAMFPDVAGIIVGKQGHIGRKIFIRLNGMVDYVIAVENNTGQIKLLGKLNGPLHMVSVPHISSVDLQQPVLIVWLSHFHPFCSVKKAYKNSRTSIYTLKSGYIQNQSVVVFLPCYSVKRSPSSSNALLYMSTESVHVFPNSS